MSAKRTLPSRLFSTQEAATYLGLKPQTLRVWRMTGGGPKYIRFGHSIKGRAAYTEKALADYLHEHAFTSTTDEVIERARSSR